ncbi:24286_t:CDS:2 [Gigaspora rosea]|nr:24286_t:CDS:2 [Gigaspora rosea]
MGVSLEETTIKRKKFKKQISKKRLSNYDHRQEEQEDRQVEEQIEEQESNNSSLNAMQNVIDINWKKIANLVLNAKPDKVSGRKSNINFGSKLASVQEGLEKWNEVEIIFENAQAEMDLYRLHHFLNLYDAYVVLFKFAIEERTVDLNMKISQKKKNQIPLGVNAHFRFIRGWVGYQMRLFRNIKDDRYERRIWTALCRIRFIITNGIATEKALAISGASPNFFQMLPDELFNKFIKKISEGKYSNFELPNSVKDAIGQIMTPITWNVNDKSALLNVDSNGLGVKYMSENTHYYGLLKTSRLYYITYYLAKFSSK